MPILKDLRGSKPLEIPRNQVSFHGKGWTCYKVLSLFGLNCAFFGLFPTKKRERLVASPGKGI